MVAHDKPFRDRGASLGITRVWIGLTDQVTEGTWRWLTGEPTSYTNWAGGEPNNVNNEDYAALYRRGTWLDLGVSWTTAYVCEFVSKRMFFPIETMPSTTAGIFAARTPADLGFWLRFAALPVLTYPTYAPLRLSRNFARNRAWRAGFLEVSGSRTSPRCR